MRYAFLGLAFLIVGALCMLGAKNLVAGDSAGTRPGTRASEDPRMKKATFAAGCFWGVEETFRRVPGVVSTEVGYIGGHTDNPTYKEVCTDLTGYAEAVQITYDPAKISYAELLDVFWTCHNPTTLNSQGPDFGTQYRSAIFTHGDEQATIAKASLKEVADSGVFGKKKIVTEIVPAGKFYRAEEYHQQYLEKNGGICHTGIARVTTKLAEEAKKARESGTTQP